MLVAGAKHQMKIKDGYFVIPCVRTVYVCGKFVNNSGEQVRKHNYYLPQLKIKT